jgi:Na+/proline symporter
MSLLDWGVLLFTLIVVVLYGVYKGKTTKDINGYYRSGRELPWYMVMLSIVGTQASAVTFLSGPGQAYTDGMRFLQYYFGLPLAMIVLCITFVPIFHKLNIYTAYEFLEKRFDRKTRTLTAFLFLFSIFCFGLEYLPHQCNHGRCCYFVQHQWWCKGSSLHPTASVRYHLSWLIFGRLASSWNAA